MRSQEMVGRDQDLAFLIQALDHGQRDRGLYVLTGEAGIGKSRLAAAVSDAAVERGFKVLTGRAADSENPVPYRPIAEALLRFERTASERDKKALGQVRPILTSVIPAWGSGPSTGEAPSPVILGEMVLRLLLALEGAGSLLVLEDLQFADPESLAILEYLADNLAEERALCLVTLRDGTSSPALELSRALHARRTASVLSLTRLDRTDAARVAASCLGQDDVPDQVVSRLIDRCDGLPFAIEEVLATAAAAGELVRTAKGWRISGDLGSTTPASIAASVQPRMAGLGRPAAEVIEAAAVLGVQFDWRLLPAITDLSEADVLTTMWRARDAQLIEPDPEDTATFRFRHWLTRDAIMSGLLPVERARRCAKAVAAITLAHPGLPGAWCELAAELHETAGQLEQAAELFVQAARRAVSTGALASAERCLSKAQDLHGRIGQPAGRLSADIDDALASLYMVAGDCDRLLPAAQRLLRDLEAIEAPATDRAMVCVRVARTLSECDRMPQADEYAEAARGLAGDSPDPELGGWIDAVMARCAIDAGQPGRALQLARHALATAEATGFAGKSADAACEALEVTGRVERVRDTSAAARAFERAYQVAIRQDLPFRQVRALHELGTIDMYETAGWQRLSQAKELAVRSGAGPVTAVLDLQLANVWSLGDDLDRAIAAAQRCQRAASQLGLNRVEASARLVEASALAILGKRREAESLAWQSRQLAPDDAQNQAMALGDICVTAALGVGDIDGAVAASTEAMSHARADPVTAASLAWGYWALLRSVTGPDGAEAIAEATAAGAGVAIWNRACLAFAQAIQAGREGDQDRAAELAAAGADHLAGCANSWTHLLRWLTAPAAFADNWGDPVGWMQQAIPDLQGAGLDQLACACRKTLRQHGKPVPRAGRGNAAVPEHLRKVGVTSREMDVLLLVEQGYSVAVMADRLSISPKTVQTHLASLTAKTGLTRRQIASRSGQARIAVGPGAPDGEAANGTGARTRQAIPQARRAGS